MLHCRIALLVAWSVVPPRPTCHPHRHRPLQLNFLDDYKTEQGGGFDGAPTMDPGAIAAFIDEVNSERMEELRQVARVKGTEDGVDWATCGCRLREYC